MTDEKYSVTFDMIAKGGRPLVLNAPPMGAGAIGFASGGNASQQKAQANAWAVAIGAAVVSGMMKGFGAAKSIKTPTKIPSNIQNTTKSPTWKPPTNDSVTAERIRQTVGQEGKPLGVDPKQQHDDYFIRTRNKERIESMKENIRNKKQSSEVSNVIPFSSSNVKEAIKTNIIKGNFTKVSQTSEEMWAAAPTIKTIKGIPTEKLLTQAQIKSVEEAIKSIEGMVKKTSRNPEKAAKGVGFGKSKKLANDPSDEDIKSNKKYMKDKQRQNEIQGVE